MEKCDLGDFFDVLIKREARFLDVKLWETTQLSRVTVDLIKLVSSRDQHLSLNRGAGDCLGSSFSPQQTCRPCQQSAATAVTKAFIRPAHVSSSPTITSLTLNPPSQLGDLRTLQSFYEWLKSSDKKYLLPPVFLPVLLVCEWKMSPKVCCNEASLWRETDRGQWRINSAQVCVFVSLDKGAPCVIWHTAQCEVAAGSSAVQRLLSNLVSTVLSLLRGTKAVLGNTKTWGLRRRFGDFFWGPGWKKKDSFR